MQLEPSFPLGKCTCVISTGELKIMYSDDAEVLLSFLKDCGHANFPTGLDFYADHHYQHVDNLIKSRIE